MATIVLFAFVYLFDCIQTLCFRDIHSMSIGEMVNICNTEGGLGNFNQVFNFKIPIKCNAYRK